MTMHQNHTSNSKAIVCDHCQSHILYYLTYMQTIHRKEEITVWWLFNNRPITIIIIIIWRIFFLHKSVWIFVFYMYIHTLYLTQVKLCWMSPTWPKPTVSPKEGSLRQRTWQRALPRHRCPSTERWELRRAKRKNTENRMVSERGRSEREREMERKRRGYDSQRRCLPFLCATPPNHGTSPSVMTATPLYLVYKTGPAVPTHSVKWHLNSLNIPVIKYCNGRWGGG